MPAPDPVAEAFALFNRLRDARSWRCDYRHTELEAFRMAVESLAQPAPVGRAPKRKKPGSPGSSS